MFRYRSLAAFLAWVSVAIFSVWMQAGQIAAPQAQPPSPRVSHVRVGIDVLEEQHFRLLRGKRIGLITNQTGVDWRGRRTIDVIAHASGVKLVALFSPEHGIGAKANAPVGDSVDGPTDLPIYSLYGNVRRPTEAMLNNVDVLVFDIQDAGVRFYTYVTTMAYCMEEAAKRKIPFFVLDRPNPLGGEVIEGPTLDPDRTSFTGYFPMPVRYAMTMGEFAQMFNAENHIGADLYVMTMQGWHRRDTYDQTGLPWIPPSPNLRTVNAVFLYPGVEILQAGEESVGRGTDTPFELVGAPWIHSAELAAALNSRNIPGVSFAPAQFTPSEDPYNGKLCQGVRIRVTERDSFRSMRMGLEIAHVLHQLYPSHLYAGWNILLGSQSTFERLIHGDAPADIVASWSADLDKFRKMREKYLLYK